MTKYLLLTMNGNTSGNRFSATFLDSRRDYEKTLASLIETAIGKNEIRNVNPYVAVLTILSAVRGLEFWQRNKRNVDAKTLENEMVDYLLNGIIKQPVSHEKQQVMIDG